jgi:hypothetical protein
MCSPVALTSPANIRIRKNTEQVSVFSDLLYYALGKEGTDRRDGMKC